MRTCIGWFAHLRRLPATGIHILRTQSGLPKRDRVAEYLYDRGIYTTVRYHPLHLDPIFGSAARLPTAERIGPRTSELAAPPRLSADDVS